MVARLQVMGDSSVVLLLEIEAAFVICLVTTGYMVVKGNRLHRVPQSRLVTVQCMYSKPSVTGHL